jgi:hypothetical protein
MSRIPLVEPDLASDDIREMFGRMEKLGFTLLNVFKIVGKQPKSCFRFFY